MYCFELAYVLYIVIRAIASSSVTPWRRCCLVRILKAALLCTTPANLASTIRSKICWVSISLWVKSHGRRNQLFTSLQSENICNTVTAIWKSDFVLIFLYIGNKFWPIITYQRYEYCIVQALKRSSNECSITPSFYISRTPKPANIKWFFFNFCQIWANKHM